MYRSRDFTFTMHLTHLMWVCNKFLDKWHLSPIPSPALVQWWGWHGYQQGTYQTHATLHYFVPCHGLVSLSPLLFRLGCLSVVLSEPPYLRLMDIPQMTQCTWASEPAWYLDHRPVSPPPPGSTHIALWLLPSHWFSLYHINSLCSVLLRNAWYWKPAVFHFLSGYGISCKTVPSTNILHFGHLCKMSSLIRQYNVCMLNRDSNFPFTLSTCAMCGSQKLTPWCNKAWATMLVDATYVCVYVCVCVCVCVCHSAPVPFSLTFVF